MLKNQNVNFITQNFKILLFTSIVFLFSSCVAIFLPMKQSVKFNTNNEQSKIFVDNEELGEGNNVSSKIEKTGSKQVILKTPDYKDEYNVLLPERRVIAFWPLKLVDICFILPIGIDALVVEKIFKYPDNNEFTPKLKYRTRTLDEKYI
ncbi:MAG: hypothetical protein V4643_12295, partial [Bacteroidota bacterium]